MTAPDNVRGRRDKTPIVLGVIAGVLAVIVGVTLTIALTRGGSPAAAPSPTPPAPTSTPEGSGTPSSEPSDPVQEPVGVQLSATGFALVDDTGAETFSYGWSDAAAPAVTALTAAFGAAPEQRTEKGDGSHYPDYTVYQWRGFALYDMVPVEGGTPREEYAQPSWVRITANTVGDMAVTAEFDVEIGTTVDAVKAAGPDTEFERNGATRYVFAADRSSTAGGITSYSMMADTDGAAVTAILYYYYTDI